MFLEVRKAEYIDGYRIRLFFNNGKVGDVDLFSSLKGEVFAPLKDIDYFKKFSIRFNTIEWDNGADFAPEYLYQLVMVTRHDNEDAASPRAYIR